MAAKEIQQGTVIYESGQKITNLYLIMRGGIRVSYEGGSYVLRNGDVVGLSEVAFDEAYMKYEAIEKTMVMTYPYSSGKLMDLFNSSSDSMRYFMSSMFHQLSEILNQYKLLKVECLSLHDYLVTTYEDYLAICQEFMVSPGQLDAYDELSQFVLEDDIAPWLDGYYTTLEQLMTTWDHNSTDIDFITGLLSKTCKDVNNIVCLCGAMVGYKQDLCQLMMNENRLDLFDLFLSLFSKNARKQGYDSTSIKSTLRTMNDILLQLETQHCTQKAVFDERKNEYEKQVKLIEAACAEAQEEEEKVDPDALSKVRNSLKVILSYADCEKELADSFTEHVKIYKETVNKNGTEDDARKLRMQITKEFNQIYILAFQNSVNDYAIPTIVKMFFNFGYVDEELAGLENAVYMYQVVNKLETAPDQGVYSYYEWLMAIYDGRKDPGRNEFEMDYVEYLHEQFRNAKITKEEEGILLHNQSARVMYELENVFPVVNKTTSGRISTYCPLFSEHNMLKPIDTILVTEAKVLKTVNIIRKIDYSAYYRETVYSSPENGITKEYINVEILPDFILTPNAGTRGIMWQEIEGKRRTTPARMFCSILQLEDLNMQIIRLTGQFRWEMCKRIQGGRWNDVSDRSLTSEYFDYIQFYRKNNDLSAEAKDRIKADMGRCKNSFKEMFVRDYCLWILFESNGSPRLNKVSRSILFTYCTLSKPIRMKLAANPMYRELIEHYTVKMGQRKHRMENLVQKLKNMGKDIPAEIQKEQTYIEM